MSVWTHVTWPGVRFSCTATIGLSRWNWLWMAFVDNVQRSVLLNLAGLYCDFRDLKSWILCNLNGLKLRGVESPRKSLERTEQCSMRRLFLREPKAPARTGAHHPHEVPAGLADHRIENRRSDLFYQRPIDAKGIPERIQIIRQEAASAQKHGTQPHACALLDTAVAAASLELDAITIGRVFGSLEEGCLSGSTIGWSVFGSACPGSTPEKPVASG